MAKKKKHPLKSYILIVTAAVLLAIIGLSMYDREDLGAQLPPPPPDAIYKQYDQPVDARVRDLLSYMTLEEKIGQMSLVDKNSLIKAEDILRYSLGGVLSGAGAKPEVNTPQGWYELTLNLKSQAEKSRLGIPLLFGTDANHGHGNVPGATIFPHEIGLGASNDPELVQKIAQATSEELSATGINWNYSPSLDAPKDIRWGRVYEAFSDNPEINAQLGAAYISGSQMNNAKILTSAKHYIGTGSMIWGTSEHREYKIDHGTITQDEKALREYYLPPYKAAVDAGVASIMTALTRYGDTRIVDSHYLLSDVLKDDLGFKGFIVTDWYGLYEYSNVSSQEATTTAINAGVDMAMLPFDYKNFLKDVRNAEKNGDIEISRIDDAVSRILSEKFKAGLFDQIVSDTSISNVGSEENRALAREASAKSAVLLKNNSVLPIAKNNKILLAGSGADNVGRQTGAWTVEWQGVDGNWLPGSTSIRQAIENTVSDGAKVVYKENGLFAEKAAIGIAVVSEKPYAEGFGDNSNPTLSSEDIATIENLKQSADKVIVVILSGRPLLISEQIKSWDGVVAAWLPGSEGQGIADVLFGQVPFTGILPLPWPSTLEQIPIKLNGTTADDTPPLFPRGYKL